MPWILLALAVACFFIAIMAGSTWVSVLSLMAAFALMCLGVFSMVASRVSNVSRSELDLMGPDELRRLREMAARREAGGTLGPAGDADGRDGAPRE